MATRPLYEEIVFFNSADISNAKNLSQAPNSPYTQKLTQNVSDMNVRPKILKPFGKKWNKFP
jgi:hypothetical protein